VLLLSVSDSWVSCLGCVCRCRCRQRFMDVLLLCQFVTWTFRCTLNDLPSGRFASWTFRAFGHFDTRTFRYLPGRFATCLKVFNLRYCNNLFVVRWRNIQGGGKTFWYRNVQRCETSRLRSQVANRQSSETSCYLTGQYILRTVYCICNCDEINFIILTGCQQRALVDVIGVLCFVTLSSQLLTRLLFQGWWLGNRQWHTELCIWCTFWEQSSSCWCAAVAASHFSKRL